MTGPTKPMLNVVHLPPTERDAIKEQQQINLVDTLTMLLEKANAGELESMIVSTCETKGYLQYVVNVEDQATTMSYIGFMDICKTNLIDMIRMGDEPQ